MSRSPSPLRRHRRSSRDVVEVEDRRRLRHRDDPDDAAVRSSPPPEGSGGGHTRQGSSRTKEEEEKISDRASRISRPPRSAFSSSWCPSHDLRSHLPDPSVVAKLREVVTQPHVDSYNYFVKQGLQAGIRDIPPVELDLVDPKLLLGGLGAGGDAAAAPVVDWDDTTLLKFWVQDVNLSSPVRKSSTGTGGSHNPALLPRECRERGLGYAGPLTGTFCYQVIRRRNGAQLNSPIVTLDRKTFGELPVMVLSERCHLKDMSPQQLVRHKEEQTEMGGYFVVSGIERCIRLLQVPRRNYATAIQRNNFKNRGQTYTDLGVTMRCSRWNGDQSSVTNTVHYLTTGGATLRFVAKKQEFLLPIVLVIRALSGDHHSRTATTGGGGGADAAAGGQGAHNHPNNAASSSTSLLGSAASGITDEELYKRLIQGDHNNPFLVARARLLLQEAPSKFPSLNTPHECLSHIGSRFRRFSLKSNTTTDQDIGHYMIQSFVCVHCHNYADKLETLLHMLRKLWSFAAGACGPDNPDSLQNQEILLPGHLISTFVKEKFDEYLQALRLGITIEMRKDYDKIAESRVHDPQWWSKMVDRYFNRGGGSVGKKLQHFLSTGNLVSTTGLDLMQTSGYTIVAERLNFLRYCAHFRSVHRGQFFMEMKTTAVRKLLPDQWGFLCPVHTPDGGPCGLLSHLSLEARILSNPVDPASVLDLESSLYAMGVSPAGTGARIGCGAGRGAIGTHRHLPVCVDGKLIGGAAPAACRTIASALRELKTRKEGQRRGIPAHLEVALIVPGNPGAPYPGLYLFTCPARLVRPVLHLASGQTELISPLEQGFLDIACLQEDVRERVTTHQELDPTNMLSLIANLTPFSDQNQSPRNMYQCQMGKQTMGTPCHSFPYRSDNKLYRLHTPQAPLVQTATHGLYRMDEYPNGANAIVAVLSYTGFDMEDAMILNKASFERGFGHASVYKTVEVDLQEEAKMAGASSSVEESRMKFASKLKTTGETFYKSLEVDGLPRVGDRLQEGDPICSVLDSVENRDRVVKHKDKETAYVQAVRALGSDGGSSAEDKVAVTLRIPRNPVIGDKFSSRHGQKGVLSILWPHEDMPFSESGISPDVIINPHAFPSRMTIGMLVESMAGKAGALHGHYQDSTPFTFHESGDKVSVDYFGEQLQAAGYNYYGSEALYSGVSGCVMHADLFIGVVYYQRLRHMVSDKYQVRSTGPSSELTRQPIKGRKKGGGIRLGEMERDSLLSHGAAYLLHDRLLNCSDKHVAYACSRCGDLLLPCTERNVVQTTGQSALDAANKPKLRMFCRNPSCVKANGRSDADDDAVEPIILPYVYRYLVNELAGMNVRMKLDIR